MTHNKRRESRTRLPKAGKQTGAQGFWRKQPLKAEMIVPHYPDQCAACNHSLTESDCQRYMGHYVLELSQEEPGFRIVCQLHHYYRATCPKGYRSAYSCGHCTQAKPGTGYVSAIEGRTRDLKLTEYVLVGPVLATFIASLGVRYRMSRSKIQEFLHDWVQTELSTGTIDRCIREAGIACVPVVQELVEQLQQAEPYLDETHWYEPGKLHWLWVALTTKTAVFHIGSRRKEELSHLVTEAFIGWLITDGYGAYRSYPKRQRCLAHLIRKAIAITGAINQKAVPGWGEYFPRFIYLDLRLNVIPPIPALLRLALEWVFPQPRNAHQEAAQIGQWILDHLRELIATIARGEKAVPLLRKVLAGLTRVCYLGKKSDLTLATSCS